MQIAWAVHPTTYQDKPATWVTVMDITERGQIMQTLREREEHLRLALQAADMSAWSWQVKTDSSTGDSLREGIFGVAPDTAGDFFELIHPADRPRVEQEVARLLEFGGKCREEYRIVRPDGSIHWLLDAAEMLQDEHGQPERLIGVSVEITARKVAEEQLRWAHDQLARRMQERSELLRRLVSAHENERRHIARELHDETGQLIAALKLGLKPIAHTLAAQADTDGSATAKLQRVGAIVEQIEQRLRALTLALRPAGLDDLGLLAVLPPYFEEWATRTGIAIDWQFVNCQAERFAEEVELAVYRVLQEALTNVLKHAAARQVALILELRQESHGALLRVVFEDDGCGFDLENLRQHRATGQRLGLLGMQERVTAVGGTFEIEATAGRGTTLFLSIPLADTQSQHP